MPERGTARRAAGAEYAFIDTLPAHVLVTHDPGRSEDQLFVVMDVIEALRSLGPHVWDPRRGGWFP